MSTKTADWPTGDDADETPAAAPQASAQSPATAAATAKQPAAAPVVTTHPGWTGGNVGNVTATPQVSSLHPDEDGEIEAAVPQPVAKGPSKFALPSPLPATYAECFNLHQKLNATPATSEKEAAERAEAFAVFGPHFHRVQQGPALVDIGSVTYGKSAGPHNAILKEQRWEMAAQGDMVVKDLLEEYRKLEKSVLHLTKENTELKELLDSATK